MTTPRRALILLVDAKSDRREDLAFALSTRSEFDVQTVHDLPLARAFLTHEDLVAVVCDEHGNRGDDGVALLRELRAVHGSEHVAFVLLSDAGSSGTRIGAWSLDVDAILQHPVHAAELQACVQACLRRRAMQAELSAEFSRRGADADRTIDLLLTALDAISPESRRRGEELTRLASRLADDLEVPTELLHDLRRAARLHELGRFVVAADKAETAGHAPSPALVAASAALLQPIQALDGAAELIAGMGANWDGSGPLTHLQRGAIPMRSRILRVAVDYFAWRRVLPETDDRDAKVCEEMTLHSGTYYDTAVFSELALIVSNGMEESEGMSVEPLRVEQLVEGRMLVNDLCTASGIKLLSAGAVLTSASLRLIAERHALDPIVHAVATRRSG